MVAEKLVSVYNDLVHKYGDVSAESKLSGKVKAIFFLYLCLAMEKICTTMVLRVTEDKLILWWCYIKAVYNAGFKVQFAVDYLKRVVHAYFGLQALRYEKDELDPEEKTCIEAKEEQKQKLEEVKGRKAQHEALMISKKSSFIEKCIEEGSLLQYEIAGDILLM